MITEIDDVVIATHLGKSSNYISQYDPSLLVGEVRASNRKHIGIAEDNLPFIGIDIWNGYEFTCLLDNGLPVSGIARVIYSANSEKIVESKSMKLYWNSFHMMKMGEYEEEAFDRVAQQASKDLNAIIGAESEITVNVYTGNNREFNNFFSEDNYSELLRRSQYRTLENHVTIEGKVTQYKEDSSLLQEDISDTTLRFGFFHSALLRSNCRVTKQPDFGDVFIYYKGSKLVTPESVLKYIVSFRNENHFHEEICETIYKRLFDFLNPKELSVMCFYTRRGGWDINPIRASHDYLIPDHLRRSETWLKTFRQ